MWLQTPIASAAQSKGANGGGAQAATPTLKAPAIFSSSAMDLGSSAPEMLYNNAGMQGPLDCVHHQATHQAVHVALPHDLCGCLDPTALVHSQACQSFLLAYSLKAALQEPTVWEECGSKCDCVCLCVCATGLQSAGSFGNGLRSAFAQSASSAVPDLKAEPSGLLPDIPRGFSRGFTLAPSIDPLLLNLDPLGMPLSDFMLGEAC